MQWVEVGSIMKLVENQKTKTTKKQTLKNLWEKGKNGYRLFRKEAWWQESLPADLREEFESGLILTRGFGKYLHLYSKNVWDKEVEPALEGSILDEKVADINVRFRRGKTGGMLDQKQGRITIEKHLLDYAGIDRDVVAVRAGKYWRLMRPDSLDWPTIHRIPAH